MISIYQLTGYKYFGNKPDAPLGHNMSHFRDNLTYLNISFSDWKEDRKMLTFIFKEHIELLNITIIDNLFANYLVDNAIPRLNIVIKEHTDETKGKTALMVVKGEDPTTIFLQNGGHQENVLELIARKKRFYDKELPQQKEAERATLGIKRAARRRLK